jgi:hypothetical protein
LHLQVVAYTESPLPTLSAGQYYVSPGGTYTFHSSDVGVSVAISYRYTVSGSGHTLTVNNLIMGSSRPSFSALFQNPYDGDQEILLYNCKATKVTFAIKMEEYTKMDIDFMASADASGRTIEFLSSY